MKNQTPKTWNELLDAGYVIELTEEQIAIAKDKFNMNNERPFSYANGDHLASDENEIRMRQFGKK